MQSAADGFKSGRWEGKEYKAIIPKQAQRMPISYMEPRRISISSRSSATSEASEESQRTTNRIIPIIAMARNYSSNHLKEERKEQRARERERERERSRGGERKIQRNSGTDSHCEVGSKLRDSGTWPSSGIRSFHDPNYWFYVIYISL